MVLFITGHDRSGTTLLRKLCNRHPEIAVTNEFGSFAHIGLSYWTYSKHMFARWYQVRNRFYFDQKYITRHLRRLSNFAFNTKYMLHLSRQHHAQITAGDVGTTMNKMYPLAKIVGDKRTEYMAHLRHLVGTDGLSGIIIYRDGRDVTSSFLRESRTTWKNQDWVKNLNTAASVARRWVHYIELMEQYEGQLHTIRYENLVQEPRVELAALADWLGVAPEGFSIADIRADSIGKHRQDLTAEELAAVMDVAGPTLARCDYI